MKLNGLHKTKGKKMFNNKSMVKIEFHFENEITASVFEKYENKIQRFINNTSLEATGSLFLSRSTIEAVIIIDESNMIKSDETVLRNRLIRLIDSHKEAATYQWGTRELIGNMAA